MFSTKFTAILTALVAATAVSAAPADVVRAPITAPTAGTVWTVSSTQTVTWDTTGLANATGQTAQLFLGFLEDGSDDEHIDLDHPLGNGGFTFTDGKVEVTVPDVVDRDDYIVVLFGDSGDISPKFTITH